MKFMSFEENGVRFLQCKRCLTEYVSVSDNTVTVTCWKCVHNQCVALQPLETFYPSLNKKSSGRPPGWHFMKIYVDKNKNVFHKGVEQPKLKGTLKSTKVKPSKKRKTLSADEKMFKLAKKYKEKKKLNK